MSGEKKDYGEVIERPGVRLSWVWVFPVLAAAAVAWMFWSNWESRGPEIEIRFGDAPGMHAGKTPLVYRGVAAGKVTAVRFDPGLQQVVLSVRLQKFAAELAREGTVFWIEQPVLELGETSGIDALIQGNSLQARMGEGPPAFSFTGVNHAPLTPLESPALVLKLSAPSIVFLDRGSPLFYRGVRVGLVEDKALDESGKPYLRAVVEQEFAGTVRSNTRFWPASATSIRVGPGGVKLDLMGLKAILLGGVEFDVFGPPGEPVRDEAEFTLYPDQVSAQATGQPVRIAFRNGTGLVAGETQVRYLGMPVGFLESATLDQAGRAVNAVVRFQPAYDHLHPEGTVFTLVRPHISLKGMSGLDTLMGGVYIDCTPAPGGPIAHAFEGRALSDADLLAATTEREGLRVVLHARSLPPSVDEGTPILYRGLAAGKVLAKSGGPDGEPFLDAVVRKDFAKAVLRNARFWCVPAASVQAGPGVLKVDVAGLETLVQGAVAFDVFGPPEAAAENGAKFPLFANETAARATSPPIRVTFENGQGLLAGQTQVRHLGVPVGFVESVTSRDGKVEAVIRLNDGYDFLRREGSAYSIVRLDLSLNGVSGLETLLSGIYIECVPGEGRKLLDRFTGVSAAKAAFEAEEERGLEVVVTAPHTNIAVDAPVSYRGLPVGKVGRKVLSDDGREVGLCVVIDPPYSQLVRANTKFWDVSGVKLSLGFFSLKMQATSLDAVTRGGLAFATPDNMGPPVKRGHEFELHRAPRREWLRWAPEMPADK